MKYTKQISDGFIVCIGTGGGGVEITEAEYEEILTVIRNKPARTDTTDYRLREDLTWEAYEVEPPEPEEEELSDAEALEILLGGGDA